MNIYSSFDKFGIKVYNDKEGKRLNYEDLDDPTINQYIPPLPKSEDIIYTKEVTLEDLYNGCQSKLRITRNIICTECKGSDRKPEKYPTRCPACNGTGHSPKSRLEDPCSRCNGYGEIILQSDQCQLCQELFLKKGSLRYR